MGKVRVVPRSGLLGERILDNNALDTSGNGKNGTATNVTYTDTDRGYQYKSATFSGNGYIDLGDTSTNFGTITTISAWFKYTNITDTGKYFISNRDASSGGEFLLHQESATLVFDGIDQTSNGWASTTVATGLVANQWNYMTLVRTGSTTATIYINNNAGTNITNTRKDNGGYGNQSFLLGTLTTGTGYWNGSLQDVRFYNRVLTEQERQTLYMEGLKKLGGESYLPLMDGLVMGADLNGDASEQIKGANGTPTNITWSSSRLGGLGAEVNSTTGLISFPAGLTDTLNLTMSIWVYNKQSSFTNKHHVLFGNRMGAYFNGGIEIPDSSGGFTYNHICFLWTTSATFYGIQSSDTAISLLPQNTWTHLVVTRGGTGTPSECKMYINGQSISVTTNGVSAPSLAYSQPTHIGGLDDFSSMELQGIFNDAMIFSRALSDDEVKALYTIQLIKRALPY